MRILVFRLHSVNNNTVSDNRLLRLASLRAHRLGAIAVLLIIGVMDRAFVYAQSNQAGPTPSSFDVASIKPNQATDLGFRIRISPGRFEVNYARVTDLIEFAYRVKDSQILNAPRWASSDRYDIAASVTDDALVSREQKLPRDQQLDLLRLRVKSLLRQRFGLTAHSTMTKLPALRLVIAKNGPKFSQVTPTHQTSDRSKASDHHITMTMSGRQWIVTLDGSPLNLLVSALSGQPEIGGRTIEDRTGLTGVYTFTLKWLPDYLTDENSDEADSQGASLFTALREQLGLKLEPTKALVQTIVIDHVDRPSAN